MDINESVHKLLRAGIGGSGVSFEVFEEIVVKSFKECLEKGEYLVTQLKDGFMSAADKKKLDGIAKGAQVNSITGVKGSAETNYRTGKVSIAKADIGLGNVENTLDKNKRVAHAVSADSATNAGNANTVNHHTVDINVPSNAKFTDTTYSLVTSSAQGLMSAVDKKKLDGIAAGAQVNTVLGIKGDAEKTFRTGNVNINKANIGLGNVDNTADKVKRVSYADSAGNAAKVGNHTVAVNVPANAKFTDTTYGNFVKSGAGARAGLVPAPSTTAGTTKYLREDGTWQVPPDTKSANYAVMSATEAVTGTATAARAITAKVLTDKIANDMTKAFGRPAKDFATATNNTLNNKLDKNATAVNAAKVNGLTVQTAVPPNAKFTDTTYGNMTAATAKAAGRAGLVPAPPVGAQGKFLRGDGTWQPFNNMSAATATAAGRNGFVPAPPAGAQTKFLRGDGTWQPPPPTVLPATAAPRADGAAAVGASAKFAREDHVHPLGESVMLSRTGKAKVAIARGQLVGYQAGGYVPCNNTNYDTLIGICIARQSVAAGATLGLLVQGDWNTGANNDGKIAYVGTNGAIVYAQPTATNSFVKIVGHVEGTILKFYPDTLAVQLA